MSQRRPQDLVFTLFGDYLLRRPDPVWVGSLIALLCPLGVSAGAARTALSRMTGKGWFETVRDGRLSFYALSPKGRRLLEKGEARIYDPPRPEPWDGTWTLLAYSIPEDRRHLRDGLRNRLSWLGFGSLGNGLWISPQNVLDEIRETAESLEVMDHLEVFQARHQGFSDPGHLVAQCWDLEEIDERYAEFIEAHRPEFEACRRGLPTESVTDEECFVRRFDLIHEYREFFLIDPLLPRTLLPDGWKGEEAGRLFRDYHDLLVAPADRFVESVLAEGRRGAGVGG